MKAEAFRSGGPDEEVPTGRDLRNHSAILWACIGIAALHSVASGPREPECPSRQKLNSISNDINDPWQSLAWLRSS